MNYPSQETIEKAQEYASRWLAYRTPYPIAYRDWVEVVLRLNERFPAGWGEHSLHGAIGALRRQNAGGDGALAREFSY